VLLVNAGLGGMNAPPSSARTVLWRWTGQEWVVLDSLGPPVRNLGGVAYDPERNRLVVFGGSYSQNLVYDETWEWSRAAGWQHRDVPGPGRRDHTDMVYDREQRRVVLFGGQMGTTSFPGDTWAWDGTSWERVTATGPGGRIHHTLVYDAGGRRTLLFGGYDPARSADLGDTWSWNGTSWSAAAQPTAPRTHARLGQAPDGIVLVGGLQADLPAVLRLAGTAWGVAGGSSAPATRYLTALAFDPVRNVTVLFGGGDPFSDRLHDDTWEYSTGRGWVRIR
jgi:hypothetical protein